MAKPYYNSQGSGAFPDTNCRTTGREHVEHLFGLVTDLEAKALTNNDVPARPKLFVKNFLENSIFIISTDTGSTLMFLAQSSLLAAWLSQAWLQMSITWKGCSEKCIISSSTHLLLHLVVHVCVADHGEGVAARWRSLHLSHPDCIDVRT